MIRNGVGVITRIDGLTVQIDRLYIVRQTERQTSERAIILNNKLNFFIPLYLKQVLIPVSCTGFV